MDRPRKDNDRRVAALVFLRWHLMKGKRLGLLWKGEFKATQHQSKNVFFAEAKTKTTLLDVLDICMDTCEEEKGDYGKLRILAYWAAQLAVPILSFLDDNGDPLSNSHLKDCEDKYRTDLGKLGKLRRKLKEERVKTILKDLCASREKI